MFEFEFEEVVTEGSMADIISLLLVKAIEKDRQLDIPPGQIKTLSIDIPIDIQVQMMDGSTIILNREIKGDIKRIQGDVSKGQPNMVGEIHIH